MSEAAHWSSGKTGQTTVPFYSMEVLVSLKYLRILETQKDNATCTTTGLINDNGWNFP